MAATAEPKTRAPKAIAVSKLIGGKLVTELADSEFKRLAAARILCANMASVPGWEAEAKAAAEAILALQEKVNGKA